MARTSHSQRIPSFDLQSVSNEPYVFALASKGKTIIGVEPEAIVKSWKQAELYYKKRWLIGWMGYEQGYQQMQPPADSPLRNKKTDAVIMPNMYFGVFKRVLIVDRLRVKPPTTPLSLQWKASLKKKQYLQAIAKLKKHIAVGDIYQGNFSYRFSAEYNEHPYQLFRSMYQQQPTSYAAYMHTPRYSVSSVSPELFLDIRQQLVETHPMKGTLQRSAEKQQLHDSVKDKAELDMIIDVHRNDLARTAVPGAVHVKQRRRIRAFPTVWQADAIIQSRIAKAHSSLDVLNTTFPAGSITGAPKLRAMEILHELEPHRRNIYTGSIGYIAPNGDATFSVAIRTAYTVNKNAYYHVGGGIVFDSDPESEYRETLHKAKIILE